MASSWRRVLSVQSHVVHGYVGNRAAVFPLQLLGFDVDVVNSVQFSCHTGYPHLKGSKMDGNALRELVDGLRDNEVLSTYSHLLTGYIGTASFLREVIKLRSQLPAGCRYICDPVLGDNGQLYVPEDLVDVYRNEVLQYVTVLTPNQFEAELLTRSKIRSLADAARVCDQLHALGPETIILTTVEVEEGFANCEKPECLMVLSQAGCSKYLLRLPLLEGGPFTGTGDLSAAMLLAWTQHHPLEIPLALEKTGAVLQAVIRETKRLNPDVVVVGGKTVPPELRLIESKRAIEKPSIEYRCCLLEQSPDNAVQGVMFDLEGAITLPGQDLSALKDPKLQPGFREAVHALVARGVRVGIVSRSCRECVDAVLRCVDLPSETFESIVTRTTEAESGFTPTPVWGIDAAATLFVAGDVDGLQRGRSAGNKCVALIGDTDAEVGPSENDIALAKAADYTVSRLSVLAMRYIA